MINSGGGMLASERPKYWQSKLFTASGTWVVPADVGCIWVDASAGGGGGAGGNATPGGGGGGGNGGSACSNLPMPVTPGETLTITLGAAGLGGAIGAVGGNGGYTEVVGSLQTLRFLGTSNPATAGANPNGGNGGRLSNGATSVGGAGAGPAAGIQSPLLSNWGADYATQSCSSSGSAGGALGFDGGANYALDNLVLNNYVSILGAVGGASGGGGGIGGNNRYGRGGLGGSNGAVGANATGYGAGGGGGSGNAKGGDGSPGMIRIYCLSSFPI